MNAGVLENVILEMQLASESVAKIKHHEARVKETLSLSPSVIWVLYPVKVLSLTNILSACRQN
jgi:hypothetical protein